MPCGWCHKGKTAGDVAEKSRTARVKAKHAGIKRKSAWACSKDSKYRKKINGEVVLR